MLTNKLSQGVRVGFNSRDCLSSRQALTHIAPLRPGLQRPRSLRTCTECVLADRPVKQVLRAPQPATTGDAALPTPEASRGHGTRAIVLGAGMAGLAAARVLSDFFDEVVLLERDSIESEHQGAGKRGGVPQYIQPHALLVRGLRSMEALFPGFGEELVAAGGQPIDWLRDMVSWDYGTYNKRLPTGEDSPIQGIGATRALLERTFRRRVLVLRNLTLRAGTPATGVRLSPDKSRVTGVELRDGEALTCELLVDASGRGSKLPEFLAGEGRPLLGLRRDVVNSGLVYITRTLKTPPNWRRDKGWLSCVVSERTTDKVGRSGILLPIEGDCWQVVMSAREGDKVQADDEGFKEFARTLPRPDLYEAICAAEPLSAVTTYARTQNERKHFESVDMPDGLAVLGDAACCFNPIYGQGMTVGILGALELQQLLAARLAGCQPEPAATTAALVGLGTEFQPKLAKVQDFPWSVATADDASYLVAHGKRPPSKVSLVDRLLAGYFLLATRAALANTEVAKVLFSVSHLVKPPSALFEPVVALAALRLALGDVLAKLARRDSAVKAGAAS